MLRVHRFAMRLLLCLLVINFFGFVKAEESFLKPNDVIALVGGEDMVVASELGYLEALVQTKRPDYKLRFRGLGWEGDTVFEQRRDLNYPPLEAQLDKIGATVVIAQFGQAESVAGTKGFAAFENASKAFVARLRGNSKRRLVLITPTPTVLRDRASNGEGAGVLEYGDAVKKLGVGEDILVVDPFPRFRRAIGGMGQQRLALDTRDGVHLTERSQVSLAWTFSGALFQPDKGLPSGAAIMADSGSELRRLIVAKNRLWFNYSRPQNWAFLAGDRTNQPSSRDHIDRNKRWFPEELEKFVPLIEAKEKEIWELAAKLKR
jgi:hypothetical protein